MNRVCCGSRGFDAIGQPWQTRLKAMTSAANGNSAVTGEGTKRKWQRFSTRRGVPQAEAPAARSGLHRESIREIERGENNLRLPTLAAIKPHLKITMSELFKGIG